MSVIRCIVYVSTLINFLSWSPMAAAHYWIWKVDEGRITHSESYIFIAVSVFTGLPSTFNCGMQRYSGGHCYATIQPNSSRILISFLQWWLCCSQRRHTHREASLMRGVFFFFSFFLGGGGLCYKRLWHADVCLAEDPKWIVGLLLLLAGLVEKPTWHAAATCLGASQKLCKAQVCGLAKQIPTTLLFCHAFLKIHMLS